jgi:pimeloyl-ACP methyl ester carboxylesterase
MSATEEGSARTVRTGGAALRVHERGTPHDGPTILFAHGWPDSHHVWDLVADRLDGRFHLVAFDSRGVSGSTVDSGRRAFALEALATDIVTVADAVRPGGPVHLVGHDWGSVQGWEVVQDPALAERIASFTSLSGPCLDHLAATLREQVRRPSRRGVVTVLAQGSRSAYTVVLSTPGLRTGIWRLGFERVFRRWLRVSEGIEAADGHPGADLAAVAVAGVPIYRQNVWSRLRRPDPRPVAIPVQLLVATLDRYVDPRVFEDAGRWVPDLTRRELRAGHWSPRTHPDEVAELVGSFVGAVEARTGAVRAG